MLGIFFNNSYAAYGGMCLNKTYTEYVCCTQKGGWIVGTSCGAPASPDCVEDDGLIAGTSMTILEDCKKRGGEKVVYPFRK